MSGAGDDGLQPGRRGFLRDSMLLAGAAGVLAAAPQRVRAAPAGAAGPVLINANEYPDGPSPAALAAISAIAPQGGATWASCRHSCSRPWPASWGWAATTWRSTPARPSRWTTPCSG